MSEVEILKIWKFEGVWYALMTMLWLGMLSLILFESFTCNKIHSFLSDTKSLYSASCWFKIILTFEKNSLKTLSLKYISLYTNCIINWFNTWLEAYEICKHGRNYDGERGWGEPSVVYIVYIPYRFLEELYITKLTAQFSMVLERCNIFSKLKLICV